MKKKRGLKSKFSGLLKNNLLNTILLFLVVSIVIVTASDVVVKEGTVTEGAVSGTWQLINKTVISSPVNNITFFGLDGDVDEEYRITANIVNGNTNSGGVVVYFIALNDDYSGYGYNAIASFNGSDPLSANYNDGNVTGFIIGQAEADYPELTTGEMNIIAKSGTARTAFAKIKGGINMSNSFVKLNAMLSATYTDTSSNIVNMTLFAQRSALDDTRISNGIGTGTTIWIERRVP